MTERGGGFGQDIDLNIKVQVEGTLSRNASLVFMETTEITYNIAAVKGGPLYNRCGYINTVGVPKLFVD